jgi:hypothetical protein
MCRSCKQRWRNDHLPPCLTMVDDATDYPPEWIPDRPYCIPGCDRLDGHDGHDFGACMRNGKALCRYCSAPLSIGHHYRIHGRMYKDGPVVNDSCGLTPSGRYTIEDAANAMLAFANATRYSPYFGSRPPAPPLPSRCYQSEYGFTVHVRGACHC